MSEALFTSRQFTATGGFTSGIEGPACDRDGNLYAVNYARQGTIGRVTPGGECSVFVDLPEGSIANGIRFNRAGDTMFVADYTAHNVLAIDLATRAVTIHAHEGAANQPNDLAIDGDDTLYASDPNWGAGTGQLWRIGPDRCFTLLERDMGTTNGIEVDLQRRILYVNESRQRNIWAYDILPGGDLGGKRLLIAFPDFGFDGMRADIAGNLYVTRHGKGTVVVISREGAILREIPVSGTDCTNVAFGGPDGRTCYVTIADRGAIDLFRTELPGQSWQMFGNG
jgi:sugar lactone lactonase YvrE